MSVARAQAIKDIAWDYEHGFIMFPGNESGRDGHWVDAEMVARDYGMLAEAIKYPGPQTLTAYVSELERDILNLPTISETPSKFGTSSSLAEVLRNQYPEDNALKFFEDKHAVAHLAQNSLNELKMQHPVTKSWHGTPKNVIEAMSDDNVDKPLWEKSMEDEIAKFEKFNVWEECEAPVGTKLLGTKWVFKLKPDQNGFIQSFKSRLVCLGYAQKEHLHFDPANLYSPVMSYDSFRTLLAIGTANNWEMRSADIEAAFLQGHMDKPVYLKHPLGKKKNGKDVSVLLKKSVYGLKQSPRLFAKALIAQMEAGGFRGFVYDPCLFKVSHSREKLFKELGEPEKYRSFVKDNPKCRETMMVGTWVDDLTQIGSSNLILDWFVAHLRKQFVINEKSTGELSYMLSARITRDREKGTLHLDQSAAITRVAQKCGITNESREWTTPMKTDPPQRHKEKTTDFDYLSVIGSLLHICGVSRPDCAFSVSCLARFSSTAGEEHVVALKRLVAYLYQTRYMAITYRANVEEVNIPKVYENGIHPLDVDKRQPSKVFVDSDFAGTDGRSTAGYVVFLNGGPVVWSSKLMKVAATSSAEAEIIAAVESVKTGIHFQCLMEEMGLTNTSKGITIHEDNSACRMSAESLKQHKKARHYQGKLRFLQDSVQNELVVFQQTKTEDMIADIFTKSLPEDAHWKHTNTMMSLLPQYVIDLTEAVGNIVEQPVLATSDVELDCSDVELDFVEFEGSPYEDADIGTTRHIGY